MINGSLQEHKGDVQHEFSSVHAIPEIIEESEGGNRPPEDDVAHSLGEQSVRGMKMTPIEIKLEKERQPESVLKILMDRKERGYQRGIDNDGHKVGLAFDAGAFAGVVSLSMAKSLQEAGLLQYVDAFYGLSAGGINAAYVAMEQVDDGLDTYLNLMVDNEFLKRPKLFPPRFLKMDFKVLREAIYKQRPLKIKELIASKIPVVVGVHNLAKPNNPAEMFKSTNVDPNDPNKFIEQMIMGCNIMVIGGGPMKDEQGNAYTDATMGWDSAIELAIKDDCTDVLSLSNFAPSREETRKINDLGGIVAGKSANMVGNRYLNHHVPNEYKQDARRQKILWQMIHPVRTFWDSFYSEGPYFPKFSEVMARGAKLERTAQKERLFIQKGSSRNPQVAVERIYPEQSTTADALELPKLLTADKDRLRAGIAAGQVAIEEALGEIAQVKEAVTA